MTVGKFLAGILFLSTAFAPFVTNAFPFGGRITLFHVCYNETLFARLSPPVPGDYVWTTATRTYQFGPPRASGQWLLGLTGIPFDCLWSINPIFPVPAIAIMMMGSSQTSFQGVSSGGYTTDPTTQPKQLPNPTNPYDEHCRTRTDDSPVPKGWPIPTVDPCEQITRNMTCDEVKTKGYKFISRCET